MSCKIQLKNVSQSFKNNAHGKGRSIITLFEHLDLSLQQGCSYAITGPSGAGKSSLLMLLSGLEKPCTGQATFNRGQRSFPLEHLRADIGFIFQQFHLLPELTALNNIALPLKLRGDQQAISKAQSWLARVGLSARANHKPSQLSGGEQQRVAIARALVFSPKFIFADEPTGNLDQHNAKDIANTLFTCCQEHNAGLVIVTHSEDLASKAQHIYTLANGRLTDTSSNELAENKPTSTAEHTLNEKAQVMSC